MSTKGPEPPGTGARHVDTVYGGKWFTRFFRDLSDRGWHDCHWGIHQRRPELLGSSGSRERVMQISLAWDARRDPARKRLSIQGFFRNDSVPWFCYAASHRDMQIDLIVGRKTREFEREDSWC